MPDQSLALLLASSAIFLDDTTGQLVKQQCCLGLLELFSCAVAAAAAPAVYAAALLPLLGLAMTATGLLSSVNSSRTTAALISSSLTQQQRHRAMHCSALCAMQVFWL
jgi:hypothetical protein